MRGVDVSGADIDAPWLLGGEGSLLVNGVDVAPLVDAELDRRYPGRAERRAADPDGLCAAWAALERTWAATVDRAASMPAGTVDVSVDGEWSFAQTLAKPFQWSVYNRKCTPIWYLNKKSTSKGEFILGLIPKKRRYFQ